MDLNQYLPPLHPPPFADAGKVVVQALVALAPARRISVPDWAEENRRIETLTYRGRWKNDFAPYMVEPSRMMTSRRYGAVVFVGPSRTIKTDSLVLNTIGHRIQCMPRNMLVVAMTQESAREFSIEKLDSFLRSNTDLGARLLRTKNADAIHAKRFAGNMRLRIGWPVISQLSMSDIPDVLLTDYDRMPADIGGEGNAFDLSRKRNQQYGTLGKTVAESSPGRPILDDEWRAATPHEAPPCTGILSLFNRGTRGKFYWRCPHCGEQFQPLFERLRCDEAGSPGERARTTEMICPSGCCIAPDRKNELNRRGFWLHETDAGGLVEIDSQLVRNTDVVSFWGEGPIAALQDWQQLMLRNLQAEEEFRQTGDEQSLKTTVNVDQGRPYRPAVLAVGDALTREALMALSQNYPMRIVPAAARFITVHVDIQGSRFVVAIEAWGSGLERWLIDRFDIVNPPPTAPGADSRAIDPARYFEDWAGLFGLLEQAYPVEGQNLGLLPRAMIIDSGGAAGVTANAYKFYRLARSRGLQHRVFLSKGIGGLDRPRAVLREPEKQLGVRKVGKRGLLVVFLGTDPLKDEAALSLTRKEAGPGKYHLPAGLPNTVFDEFCAEHRLDKGWTPKKTGLRNEAFDHAVQGKGLVIVLGGEKINWDFPPDWAAELRSNSYAVRLETSAPNQSDLVVRPQARGRRQRSKGIG